MKMFDLLPALFGSVRGHKDNVAFDETFSTLGKEIGAICADFDKTEAALELEKLGYAPTIEGFAQFVEAKITPLIEPDIATKLGVSAAAWEAYETAITAIFGAINKAIPAVKV